MKNPPRDLDKARALLKEAGVPEGTEFTLFTRNGGGPTNPNPMLGAQRMQADLAQIGLKVEHQGHGMGRDAQARQNWRARHGLRRLGRR